jgi:hypothetical protein
MLENDIKHGTHRFECVHNLLTGFVIYDIVIQPGTFTYSLQNVLHFD